MVFNDVAFPSRLVMMYREDPEHEDEWELVKYFRVTWRDQNKKFHQISARPGFVTDLSSIPRFGQGIIQKDGLQNGPSVIHDWQYFHRRLFVKEGWNRRSVDKLFLAGMIAMGVPKDRRKVMYAAVRIGGQRQWEDDN